MILVDTSATDDLVFKFVPREYPTLNCGSALVRITDEQTKTVYTYDRIPLYKDKYWLEATISRTDFLAEHTYELIVYLYEGDNPLIYKGKARAIDFTTKGYTSGTNEKLNNKTGEFTERATTNDFIVYNG